MTLTDTQPGFFARLKQHHIYRVAVGYGTAIAIGIQVVARAFPYFGWTAAVPAVIILLIAGFPVAIVFAWLLVKPANPAAQSAWQKRHWKVGAIVTPVVIAAVAVSGIYAFKFTERHKAQIAAEQAAQSESPVPAFSPPANSIAVLPFQNLSNNPKQQYFSDGITQELTNALGQLTGLRVIAWQSVSGFRNSTLPANAIGKDLNVAYMLVGSVMREDDNLRVYAELVNTVNGYQMWSNRYDRSVKDIFAVQDDISKSIAGSMQVELGGNTHLVTAATTSTKAHDAYLKGMAAYNARSTDNLYKAIKYFQRAIKLDPNYAQAYAQLGSVYTVLPENTSMSYTEANAKALPMIHRALAINPNLAQAHAVLANIYISEHKIEAAKVELLQTLALDPNNASAHFSYGVLLPLKDALAQYQQSAMLNPESWAAQTNLALTYAELGKIPEAIKVYQVAQKLSPDNIEAPLEIAYLNHLLSNDTESVRVLTEIKPANKADAKLLEISRLSYSAVLDPKLRNQALDALDRYATNRQGGFTPYYLAAAYLVLGEKSKAIPLIKGFCGNIPDSCNDIAFDTHYLSLHSDKQFQELVATYGLKQ